VTGGTGGSTASEASVVRTPGNKVATSSEANAGRTHRTRRVVALVAAHDEADRIAATVTALRNIAAVSDVVVVDDGSRDATAARAIEAGAAVLRRDRSLGKGRALDRALDRTEADVLLFVDGDLGSSAAQLEDVLEPVVDGAADLAIAAFSVRIGGGFGIVKWAARWAIRRLTGFEATEPLSGQRAITVGAISAVRPLASGFGLETAMTIDAVRAGLRVVEVAADVSHRPTYRDVRGFAHRGRQGWDVLRAVVPRAVGLR
jgi:glycosyltransferase involved in cell wall biosynthesis